MKKQGKKQEKKFELAVFNTALAPRDVVGAGLSGHMVCQPRAMVRTGVISPGLEKVERRIQARERRMIEWQRKHEERKVGKERQATSVGID